MPQIALITFPSGVPELALNPSDASDETVRLDGAKNCPCAGINLMDLAVPILPNPERPLGPRQPRVTAAAGRRNGGEHLAALGIDLLDTILSDLKQVPAVEGCSGMRGDINRAHCLSTRGVEGIQLLSGGKPNLLTVIADSMDAVSFRKGTILTDDFGG